MGKPSSFLTFLLIAGWIIAIGISGTALLRFAGTAGATGTAATQWPVTSGLPQPRELPALVMFLHPHCPCSRASVANLARLAARLANRVRITVVLVAPPGVNESWVHGSLHDAVQEVPTVTIRIDRNGREARLFGALTSGQTYLYTGGGDCAFAGGITPLRGHEGDNPGIDAILSLALTGSSDTSTWPVTGCPLFDDAEAGTSVENGEVPVR